MLAFARSMPILAAEEALESHGGAMSPDQLRHAVRLVTGDDREADRAAAERELQRMREKSAANSG